MLSTIHIIVRMKNIALRRKIVVVQDEMGYSIIGTIVFEIVPGIKIIIIIVDVEDH